MKLENLNAAVPVYVVSKGDWSRCLVRSYVIFNSFQI
jgi:hypothetical protein